MFQANGLTANGLSPGDKMPGATASVFDEMDGLMSDWSWRPRLRDVAPPTYQYNAGERMRWRVHNECGFPLGAQQPWSFPAYRGPAAKPARIGVTR